MPDADLILALDQGTSSSRAVLYRLDGSVVASARVPLDAAYPHPGWVTQDPLAILGTTLAAGRRAITEAGIGPERIAAVGIANQRETTLLWDRATGSPVAPAIVWQSRQSAPIVDAIAARDMSHRYQAITGLVPDAYFSATKIAWLLDAEPDRRRRAAAGEILFGTVETWLLWRLSGGTRHITDLSNASRTMLVDLATRTWSPELLADLAIPAAILPEIVPNAGHIAEVEPESFGAPLAVTGCAGDQQAALFGHGCVSPGQAKNTYGTGSFLLLNVGDAPTPSRHRLLATVAWQIGDSTTYALEGAIFSTGAAVQWLRDGLGIIAAAAAIEPLAASVPDAGGVLFVPALTGLGAPWWDPRARGTVIGLTRASTAAHLCRAALDAIAYQTRDVVEAMAADADLPVTQLRVDGGAAANDLLMQIQADALGVPVVRPADVEATVRGAAMLAAVGAGLAADATAIGGHGTGSRIFEPRLSPDERDSRYAEWKRAVRRSLEWAD